jgi:hypothetical protein
VIDGVHRMPTDALAAKLDREARDAMPARRQDSIDDGTLGDPRRALRMLRDYTDALPVGSKVEAAAARLDGFFSTESDLKVT